MLKANTSMQQEVSLYKRFNHLNSDAGVVDVAWAHRVPESGKGQRAALSSKANFLFLKHPPNGLQNEVVRPVAFSGGGFTAFWDRARGMCRWDARSGFSCFSQRLRQPELGADSKASITPPPPPHTTPA